MIKLSNYYFSSILMLVFFQTIFSHYSPVGYKEKEWKKTSEKQRLFSGVNCNYSNEVKIQYPRFDQLKIKMNKYYNKHKDYYDKNNEKYCKDLHRQYRAPMYLKWISNVVGYGIFAQKDIKKGDMIGKYSGVLRKIKHDSDDLDYAWYYTIDGIDGEKLIIDGKHQGNELRFINHSNNPNTSRLDLYCRSKNDNENIFQIIYVADKDIAKNTELTVSYGDDYFTSRKMKVIEN